MRVNVRLTLSLTSSVTCVLDLLTIPQDAEMRDGLALEQRHRSQDETSRQSFPQASSSMTRDSSPPPTTTVTSVKTVKAADAPEPAGSALESIEASPASAARSPPVKAATPGSPAKHLATPSSTSSPEKSHIMETSANR